MSDRPKLTVYQRVERAARAGRGCRLTAEDCHKLYDKDEAFRDRADMDDLNDQGIKDEELI